VHLAVGNADKRRDTATQVQQRVHLHRGFVLAELRPWKQGEAQIDGGRVERIEAVVQFQTNRVLRMQWPGDADQMLSESGEDAPVMGLVGISQS
jgi:hypothetical protein